MLSSSFCADPDFKIQIENDFFFVFRQKGVQVQGPRSWIYIGTTEILPSSVQISLAIKREKKKEAAGY